MHEAAEAAVAFLHMKAKGDTFFGKHCNNMVLISLPRPRSDSIIQNSHTLIQPVEQCLDPCLALKRCSINIG